MVVFLRLLLVLLFAFAPIAAAADARAIDGPVAAEVERVVDGYTVRVAARIWVGHTVSVAVRIADVDAPELYRPRCDAERDAARRAKSFVEAMLGDGGVTLHEIAPDKYGGRVVARIETNSGDDLGAALLGEGLAVEEGESDPWCR
ncbi:MAG: thermonuclease family protein [Parvularculaceae bacterium]